jgi:hypothetical protein
VKKKSKKKKILRKKKVFVLRIVVLIMKKIRFFIIRFFRKRFLILVKISFFVLVVLVTNYRVSIIIPSMPSSADTFFLKSEIKSMTNKHEWESVSFIHQSHSLHYGRLVLSSVKRDPPLVINAKVPFHETFSENEGLFQPSSNNDTNFVEQNDFSSEGPSSLVRYNLRYNLVSDLSLNNRTDQIEELFQPWSDNDEDLVEQNGLSEERPSWLVRQIGLSRNNTLYSTDQREESFQRPSWLVRQNLSFDLPQSNSLFSTDQIEELSQPSFYNDDNFVKQNGLSEERPSWLVRENLVFDLPGENPLYNTDTRESLFEMPWWYEERKDEELEGWI